MKLYELDVKLYDGISSAHDNQWSNPAYLHPHGNIVEDWIEFQKAHGFLLHGTSYSVYVEILDEDVFTLTLLKYS